LKKTFLIKIVDKNKISTEKLDLNKIYELAKNIYDDKKIFIAVSKKNKRNNSFWSNKSIIKLSQLDNVYFADEMFYRSLNIPKAYRAIEIVEKMLKQKGDNIDKKKIFLSEKEEKIEDKENNNSMLEGETENQSFSNILEFEENIPAEEIETLNFNFNHAKENNNLKDVLNQKNIYTELDKEDNQKNKYSKDEFLKKMNYFQNLNYSIYMILLKTFETINGMKNKEGYFEIPVGVVPRPQNENGIFDNNGDEYFFTIVDITGMALYQDSIKLNKNLLISAEIYEAMGNMVLILANGYQHISHKPVDRLCDLLDIPLYYNKKTETFYKKYVDFLYDK
jgi:hypothetical protein